MVKATYKGKELIEVITYYEDRGCAYIVTKGFGGIVRLEDIELEEA